MRLLQRFYCTRIIIASIIALSLLATPSFASQIDSKRSEQVDIKKQLEANKRLLDATEKREADVVREIQANDRKIIELQDELDELKAQLDRKVAGRNQLELKLARLEKELTAAEAELLVTEKELAYKRAVFNKRVAAIYKKGSTSTLEVLLSASDLGDLFRRIGFVELIARNDSKLVANVYEIKVAVEDHRERLDADRKVVAKDRLVLIDQANAIRKAGKQVAVKHELFRKELKRQENMLARIEREQNRLKITEDMLESSSRLVAAEIRTLEQGGSIDHAYSRRISGVGFMRPSSGSITSGYGMRRHPILGYSRMHTGVDFGAALGSPIYAAHSGTVIIAGRMGGYGKTVVISHGGGLSTLYAHNSQLHVSVGQDVERGDAIANAGSTGLSTGPHLHFEVRVNGSPHNPMNWLN
ncbi:MAG: peptidoglycan DD-metalloendopeptidase family protein [Actinomycetota bacterium]|nr:peptidoglycan DD-metalloendopeptidase family protein [Actinomycetota bacterium]